MPSPRLLSRSLPLVCGGLFLSVVVSGCPTKTAFEDLPNGADCSHRDVGAWATTSDGGVTSGVCVRGRVIHTVAGAATNVTDSNPCGTSLVHGDGSDCIEFCIPTQPSADDAGSVPVYVQTVCLDHPIPATPATSTPYTSDWPGGCQAMINAGAQNGDPCAGDAWGCVGWDEKRSDSGMLLSVGASLALWCEQGMLHLVPLTGAVPSTVEIGIFRYAHP